VSLGALKGTSQTIKTEEIRGKIRKGPQERLSHLLEDRRLAFLAYNAAAMDQDTKRELYREMLRELDSVLEGTGDAITAMSTSACVLHQKLPYASWTGFYRVVAPRLLRVGPYQGSLGCLEIPFERGVCGAAARERATQLVPDVDQFPGHIACDSAARSEIVIPLYNPGGQLVAVLDVDSHQPAAFDEIDREGLEKVADLLSPYLRESTRAFPGVEA
jgi:L-methionine (R)-S-oxide reductase